MEPVKRKSVFMKTVNDDRKIEEIQMSETVIAYLRSFPVFGRSDYSDSPVIRENPVELPPKIKRQKLSASFEVGEHFESPVSSKRPTANCNNNNSNTPPTRSKGYKNSRKRKICGPSQIGTVDKNQSSNTCADIERITTVPTTDKKTNGKDEAETLSFQVQNTNNRVKDSIALTSCNLAQQKPKENVVISKSEEGIFNNTYLDTESSTMKDVSSVEKTPSPSMEDSTVFSYKSVRASTMVQEITVEDSISEILDITHQNVSPTPSDRSVSLEALTESMTQDNHNVNVLSLSSFMEKKIKKREGDSVRNLKKTLVAKGKNCEKTSASFHLPDASKNPVEVKENAGNVVLASEIESTQQDGSLSCPSASLKSAPTMPVDASIMSASTLPKSITVGMERSLSTSSHLKKSTLDPIERTNIEKPSVLNEKKESEKGKIISKENQNEAYYYYVSFTCENQNKEKDFQKTGGTGNQPICIKPKSIMVSESRSLLPSKAALDLSTNLNIKKISPDTATLSEKRICVKVQKEIISKSSAPHDTTSQQRKVLKISLKKVATSCLGIDSENGKTSYDSGIEYSQTLHPQKTEKGKSSSLARSSPRQHKPTFKLKSFMPTLSKKPRRTLEKAYEKSETLEGKYEKSKNEYAKPKEILEETVKSMSLTPKRKSKFANGRRNNPKIIPLELNFSSLKKTKPAEHSDTNFENCSTDSNDLSLNENDFSNFDPDAQTSSEAKVESVDTSYEQSLTSNNMPVSFHLLSQSSGLSQNVSKSSRRKVDCKSKKTSLKDIVVITPPAQFISFTPTGELECSEVVHKGVHELIQRGSTQIYVMADQKSQGQINESESKQAYKVDCTSEPLKFIPSTFPPPNSKSKCVPSLQKPATILLRSIDETVMPNSPADIYNAKDLPLEEHILVTNESDLNDARKSESFVDESVSSEFGINNESPAEDREVIANNSLQLEENPWTTSIDRGLQSTAGPHFINTFVPSTTNKTDDTKECTPFVLPIILKSPEVTNITDVSASENVTERASQCCTKSNASPSLVILSEAITTSSKGQLGVPQILASSLNEGTTLTDPAEAKESLTPAVTSLTEPDWTRSASTKSHTPTCKKPAADNLFFTVTDKPTLMSKTTSRYALRRQAPTVSSAQTSGGRIMAPMTKTVTATSKKPSVTSSTIPPVEPSVISCVTSSIMSSVISSITPSVSVTSALRASVMFSVTSSVTSSITSSVTSSTTLSEMSSVIPKVVTSSITSSVSSSIAPSATSSITPSVTSSITPVAVMSSTTPSITSSISTSVTSSIRPSLISSIEPSLPSSIATLVTSSTTPSVKSSIVPSLTISTPSMAPLITPPVMSSITPVTVTSSIKKVAVTSSIKKVASVTPAAAVTPSLTPVAVTPSLTPVAVTSSAVRPITSSLTPSVKPTSKTSIKSAVTMNSTAPVTNPDVGISMSTSSSLFTSPPATTTIFRTLAGTSATSPTTDTISALVSQELSRSAGKGPTSAKSTSVTTVVEAPVKEMMDSSEGKKEPLSLLSLDKIPTTASVISQAVTKPPSEIIITKSSESLEIGTKTCGEQSDLNITDNFWDTFASEKKNVPSKAAAPSHQMHSSTSSSVYKTRNSLRIKCARDKIKATSEQEIEPLSKNMNLSDLPLPLEEKNEPLYKIVTSKLSLPEVSAKKASVKRVTRSKKSNQNLPSTTRNTTVVKEQTNPGLESSQCLPLTTCPNNGTSSTCRHEHLTLSSSTEDEDVPGLPVTSPGKTETSTTRGKKSGIIVTEKTPSAQLTSVSDAPRVTTPGNVAIQSRAITSSRVTTSPNVATTPSMATSLRVATPPSVAARGTASPSVETMVRVTTPPNVAASLRVTTSPSDGTLSSPSVGTLSSPSVGTPPKIATPPRITTPPSVQSSPRVATSPRLATSQHAPVSATKKPSAVPVVGLFSGNYTLPPENSVEEHEDASAPIDNVKAGPSESSTDDSGNLPSNEKVLTSSPWCDDVTAVHATDDTDVTSTNCFDAPLYQWTKGDVSRWLTFHGLGRFITDFSEVDGPCMVELVHCFNAGSEIILKYLRELGCTLQENLKFSALLRSLSNQIGILNVNEAMTKDLRLLLGVMESCQSS